MKTNPGITTSRSKYARTVVEQCCQQIPRRDQIMSERHVAGDESSNHWPVPPLPPSLITFCVLRRTMGMVAGLSPSGVQMVPAVNATRMASA